MQDSDAFAQRKYQLRFDWGLAGAERIAGDADIVVLVDALAAPDEAAQLDAANGDVASPVAPTAGALLAALREHRGDQLVLGASLRNRTAVARRILALQEERGTRLSVAVIAAGEPSDPAAGAASAAVRFAVEDQLAAGAVIDALASLGIDHTSPEAAFACAGFEGLRRAVVHLTTASATGVALRDGGHGELVQAAAQLDASARVPVLHDGAFQE